MNARGIRLVDLNGDIIQINVTRTYRLHTFLSNNIKNLSYQYNIVYYKT